jgi:hypothetical protein
MRTMPDFQKIVLARLKTLEMTQYALVQKLQGKVLDRTVYRFLDDKKPSQIKSEALGHILDAVGLTVTPKK